MTKLLKWALICAAALVAAGLIILYEMFFGANWFTGQEEKTFFVSRGQTFSSVVDSLDAAGIISNRATFLFVARVHGGGTRVHVGKYKFRTGVSNHELLLALIEGRDIAYIPVTIPEGLMAREQAHIFSRVLGIDSARYMALVHDESFTHSVGISSPSLEGYLFPETYSFYWQTDERDVITRLVRQYEAFYSDSLQARAHDLGWTTNQVMTLASIIEGEAVLKEERPVISGVYHNRLQKGMKLEADPTIRFMLEDGRRRVLYTDLQSDNPYNTYRRVGLPPGPINNPGKASILAALFPATNNYLFFVANGRGGHWFSSTFAEHLKYVRRYRRERRLRIESSLTAREKPDER